MEQFLLFWKEKKKSPYACKEKYVTCLEIANI